MTHAQVGWRVRVLEWGPSGVLDDSKTVPIGTEGTVNYIDSAGTIFVSWDNGSGLGLVYRVDKWERVISEEEKREAVNTLNKRRNPRPRR